MASAPISFAALAYSTESSVRVAPVPMISGSRRADHILGVGRKLDALLGALRIIFAGRAADDDAVHSCLDQRFEHRRKGARSIWPSGRAA